MRWFPLHRFPVVRLLLVLGLVGLWVRSHWRSDLAALFVHGGRAEVVGADRGRLVVIVTNISFGPDRAFTVEYFTGSNDEFAPVRALLYTNAPLPANVAGVYLGGSPRNSFGLPGARYQYVVIPFAYPLALAALSLALGLRNFWLRRRWGAPGVCGGCGYDLRASAARCPECGTAVPATA